MPPIKKLQLALAFIVVALLIYFPLFLHLDSLPLQNFDEARLAVNAFQMSENHNFLITYFGNDPDLWNTKPPLMIWAQVMSMKLLGYNVLAVRLPAALSAFFTTLVLLFFCGRYLKSYGLGLIVTMVLITSFGYVKMHVTRTGDYDSMLILWMVASALFFYLFVESLKDKAQWKYLAGSAITTGLAVLTKGVAGLLFLPAMLLWIFIKQKGKWFFSQPKVWLWLFVGLLLSGSYYIVRGVIDPDYLAAVWTNEIADRYIDPADQHQRASSFKLIKNLWQKSFLPWVYFLPLAIPFFISIKSRISAFGWYAVLQTVSFLAIISFSATQLHWYDAPAFPFLACWVGIGIYLGWKYIVKWIPKPNLGAAIFVLLLFSFPYYKIVQSVYWPDRKAFFQWQRNEYGTFMQAIKDEDHYAIIIPEYSGHALFYQQVFNSRGYHLKLKQAKHSEIGDRVLFCEDKVRKKIEELYDYKVLEKKGSCELVEVTSIR